MFEESPRWAPSIEKELAVLIQRTELQILNLPPVESFREARHVLEESGSRAVVGIVIVLAGLETECLGLLARLSESNRPQPVLVVGEPQHRPLVPVLAETGSSVLIDIANDRPAADWCFRVLGD